MLLADKSYRCNTDLC